MKRPSQIDLPEMKLSPAVAAGATPVYEELPNRLMTAFEVAAFVGCHEETVAARICAGC